ncbi:MAG: Rieske (2Fe-2S) protein [Armatimonadetes bacterium]|nr:Rieske (2Fe-2S) protein [Armatimonadota bacterium]
MISEQPGELEVEDPSRRRMLSWFAGTLSTLVGAAIAAPLAGMFLAPLFVKRKELWLPLGAVAEVSEDAPTKFTYSYVKTDGWFEKTVYGTAYAVIDKPGSFMVLSNICSHLGCGVRWDTDRDAFLCPCHNGVFARDGSVKSGPPPKPLTRMKSRVADGRIEIMIEEA